MVVIKCDGLDGWNDRDGRYESINSMSSSHLTLLSTSTHQRSLNLDLDLQWSQTPSNLVCSTATTNRGNDTKLLNTIMANSTLKGSLAIHGGNPQVGLAPRSALPEFRI
jgi:hypothetical protein